MDKLFLTILNMSLTGAFVIASICLARLPLKKAPKIISYCLWAVAGFRLSFPFSIESTFSLIPFKAQTIPTDIALQPVPRLDSGITFVNNAVSTILPAATPSKSVNPLQIWTTIGSFVWFVVVAAMVIYGVVSFVILKRKIRGAVHLEANIFEAENIKSPFVLGMFKPRIYLPIGLSEKATSYILLHEQTHIRRHDHIVKIAAYIILCLHWFNPLVWVAFLLMGLDMEMSCDECVLKKMGRETKKDYSLSLLTLATKGRIIGGSPLAFGEGSVKGRIKNVLNFKKPSRVIIVTSVALVAVLSVGFAVNRATDLSISDSIIPMSMNTVVKEPHFSGTVTEVYDNAILVSVNEGEDARRSSDLISVSLNVKSKDSSTHFTNGDKVTVYYNGEIAESYPAQVNTVYAIVITSPDMQINMNDLYALSAMQTPYVGDNSAVGKIINYLPRIDQEHAQRFFSISDDYGTGRAPYTLTVYYEPYNTETSDTRNITVTQQSSAMLFSLIDNLEEISYAFRSTPSPSDGELDKEAYISRVTYSRKDITAFLETIGLEWEDFRNDWNGSVDKMYLLIEENAEPNPKAVTSSAENVSDIAQRVEDGLLAIMSSPLSSSNPQDYINEHWTEYENLAFKYPSGVLEYLLSQFEAGNSGGLRGHIMMRICKDMLGVQNNVTDESLSPQEWYRQLAIISEIKLPDFTPENPAGVYNGEVDGKVYGSLINSAILQQYGGSKNGFLVYAPTIYSAYEESGKLKVFVTVYYEYYRLFGNTLESTGGAVIPGAIIFREDNNNGGWEFEEYLEVGSANLPDGLYYDDSILKLCVMPVSGNEIKGLAEKMNADYVNDARRELLEQSLKEHLMTHGQTGVSLKKPDGSMLKLNNK